LKKMHLGGRGRAKGERLPALARAAPMQVCI